MPYIGTFGDVDPHYRTRQLEGVGSAIELALAAADRGKREKQAERDRELQRLSQLAEAYPDAAVTFGESLVAKYGEEIPHLRGMVEAIKERTSVRQQAKQREAAAEAAGQRWMQSVERREQPLREIVQNPGAWQAPLLTPDMASARIPQVPQEAAGAMSFADREAARVWAKEQGYTFPAAPTPIDPYGTTFPADTRAHLAAAAGLLPPEVAEGERIGRGLKPSVGQVMQDEQQRSAGARADQRIDLDRQAQELAERRLALDQRKESRISAGGTEGGAAKVKVPEIAGWMADETKLRADERAARLALVKADERAEAAEAMPEAPPMSRLQATRITTAIVADLKANGMPTDAATVQDAAGRAVEMYSELTSPSPELAPGKMAQHSDGTRVLVLSVEGAQAIVERNGKRFRIAANTLKPVPATREEAVRVLLGR